MIKRIEIEKKEQVFEFKLDSKPFNIIFDKDNWIIKNLRFEKTKEELLYQLKNSVDAYDRKAAINQLKNYAVDDDVFDALYNSALRDKNWSVRNEIIDSVFVCSRKEGLELLLETIKDPKSSVRISSIINLKNFNDKRISSALRETIKSDSSYYAVSYALISLAIIEKENALDEIIPFTKKDSFRDILRGGAFIALDIINKRKGY